jgi:hypothetical protein
MPNTYLYDRTTFNHRNITSKIRWSDEVVDEHISDEFI